VQAPHWIFIGFRSWSQTSAALHDLNRTVLPSFPIFGITSHNISYGLTYLKCGHYSDIIFAVLPCLGVDSRSTCLLAQHLLNGCSKAALLQDCIFFLLPQFLPWDKSDSVKQEEVVVAATSSVGMCEAPLVRRQLWSFKSVCLFSASEF
jgi:hypothetical protein